MTTPPGGNGKEESSLIDPSLLTNLSETERTEALAAAAAAKRAEERAEQRALERAIERKRQERERERLAEEELEREHSKRQALRAGGGEVEGNGLNGSEGNKVVFISKKRRADLTNPSKSEFKSTDPPNSSKGSSNGSHKRSKNGNGSTLPSSDTRESSASQKHHLTAAQITSIKKSYLGESALQDEATVRQQQLERQRRARQQKKITFKFEWDASEDTSNGIGNEDLYGFGFGNTKQSHRRSQTNGNHRGNNNSNSTSRNHRGRGHASSRDQLVTVHSVSTKPLDKMTTRDWRIFRENYDITVKGGKAPPPLRSFRETPLCVPSIHPALIDAIETILRYKEPSPIQRQAIPIGLQRRDLIGIAETGSGKTAAFGIPLCHHILSLPPRAKARESVAENGPLALVMAPTRELALQIDAEVAKLLGRQQQIRTAAVVGGQPIQQQAMVIREGVHIVVGTPGRINDCVEMAYLVLNQCSYIVLDEADRMIDLGFAPQIEQILDAMGGLLKSENEKEAYEQEKRDLDELAKGVPRHRLTAMFSATMPSEVERIAKRYLRHPAVVSIGDQDSGKNQRITQKVLFLGSPGQKENALRSVLCNQTRVDDKVIVFVNEKKHADGVGRIVEKIGRRCVVLHGGKSQDQREENLDLFRRGGMVLVATDVAGRGLDIPNVRHVINYDLPTRSIDNYCHRIGRTGRAGNQGFATSFITDADEGIMAPLKAYLESTGSQVPDRLARHPAAVSGIPGGNIR